MQLIRLNPSSTVPLVTQIVDGIKMCIDEKMIRPGSRLPSIRKFANDHNVSRFTVVQAYDRLVAMSYVISKKGSGFDVANRVTLGVPSDQTTNLERATDVLWLLKKALSGQAPAAVPGSGWLPNSWLNEGGIRKSLRLLSQRPGSHLTNYGQPYGYLPLRDHLQGRLGKLGIASDLPQIITTRGASHALDLVGRYLVRPNDTVLVDDPGYYTLFGYLKSLGAKIVGVPWNLDGPDISIMEELIKEHHPKLFFTNTVLHNPTGSTISQAVAYRILQLAEKYDLYIIEDDIYSDFDTTNATRLAALDQLNRVIYIGSFSKTISASLRVGFLACRRDMANDLVDLRLLTSMTTSEIDERLIYQVLTDGGYRKHLDKLSLRLQNAHQHTIKHLENSGLEIYRVPTGGMFIWAKTSCNSDAAEIAKAAATQGIVLAPGNLFRPHQEPSPWLRFNVAYCDDPAIFEFLTEFGID